MTEKDECDPSKKRRRRTVNTINEKVDILQLFQASSLIAIARKYNVGRSTISDIRRNKEKILSYKKDMVEMGMTRPAKVMRVADDSIIVRISTSEVSEWLQADLGDPGVQFFSDDKIL